MLNKLEVIGITKNTWKNDNIIDRIKDVIIICNIKEVDFYFNKLEETRKDTIYMYKRVREVRIAKEFGGGVNILLETQFSDGSTFGRFLMGTSFLKKQRCTRRIGGYKGVLTRKENLMKSIKKKYQGSLFKNEYKNDLKYQKLQKQYDRMVTKLLTFQQDKCSFRSTKIRQRDYKTFFLAFFLTSIK